MADIAVLTPVLGRPQNAQRVADSLAASTGRARLVFVATPGDTEELAALERAGEGYLVAPFDGESPAQYARKINWAASLTTEPFIFTGADDLEFQPGWADHALACIEGYDVCGTDDMANPLVKRGGHSTHSLVRRTYIDEVGASWDGPGTVLSEAYDHCWVDNELVQLAMHRGVWTFCKEARVKHAHPIFDRSVPMDATYTKAMANGRADQRLYQQRRKEWMRT